MHPRVRLFLAALEDRTLLSGLVLGDIWPDPNLLTLSFAPDGTKLPVGASSLFRTLNRVDVPTDWQFQILEAFQTWAAATNLNIGLVQDSGDAFGTPGQIEGDYRFGDIRIGAAPLSSDALANAVPFDWSSGTWSGDVLFNSTVPFAVQPTSPVKFDLFTTALHEAGHTLGLGHSDDPLSVMFEDYRGTRTGLGASDIAAIQSILGTRTPDLLEGTSGNDTWNTATVLSGAANISISADLTTAADQDYYRFLTPAQGGKFAVELQTSGISLLTARVTVYNAAGQAVGSDVSTDPTNGNLVVRVEHADPASWYTIRVDASRPDVFGIGAYRLSVIYKDQPLAPQTYQKDGGGNDAAAGASNLNADPGSWWKPSDGGWFNGVLENKNDVDYYRVMSPTDADGTQALFLQVIALNGKGIVPKVSVYDAAMNLLPVQVVGSFGHSLSLEVLGISRGQAYFVKITGNGSDDTNGNYRLAVDFGPPQNTGLSDLQVGTLADGATTATGHLSLPSSGLVQLGLDARYAQGSGNATVTLTVTDATGKRMASAVQTVGQPAVSLSIYLPAGDYTLTLSLGLGPTPPPPPHGSPSHVDPVAVIYLLTGGFGSDPIGPFPTSTGTGPGTTGSSTHPTTTVTSSSGGGFFYTVGSGLFTSTWPYSF